LVDSVYLGWYPLLSDTRGGPFWRRVNVMAASPFLKQYGPWAVVTGASSGIGRAFAGKLASSGLSLVLVGRSQEALIRLEEELSKAHGTQSRLIVADLGEASGVEKVILETKDLEVGLFVASAGFGSSGPFLDADPETEGTMIEVNCLALMKLTHALGGKMAAQGRGGVILLSSLVSWQGAPFSATYSATKAFVQSLAESLSVEWKPKGVHVQSCAPGPVISSFGERANMAITSGATPEEVAETSLRHLGRRSLVIPGLMSKVLSYSLFLTPRPLRVQIMKKVMSGLTKSETS
jgi:uncharacterized protein